MPADIPDDYLAEPVPPKLIADAFGSLEIIWVPAITGGWIRYAEVPPERSLPAGWRSMQTRQAVHLMSAGQTINGSGPAGHLLRAYHLAQWRRDSVFCGTCGSKNADADNETARVCPACGRREYPRISPAIIVLIINDQDQALLAHNINFTAGIYSLIAGFNEAGETLEATVARETREEVGLEVRDIRYVTSQPWPFPNSLMLGFTARYAEGTIKVDGAEIEDARWFNRNRLPDLPGKGSVSRHIINLWLEHSL